MRNLQSLSPPRSCHAALTPDECHIYRAGERACKWVEDDGTAATALPDFEHSTRKGGKRGGAPRRPLGSCTAGARINCDASPPPSPPPLPELPELSGEAIAAREYHAAPGADLCANLCPLAFDGTCDDGGTGAAFTDCSYGSDCADCGARGHVICSDTCFFNGDGVCDDGGKVHDGGSGVAAR